MKTILIVAALAAACGACAGTSSQTAQIDDVTSQNAGKARYQKWAPLYRQPGQTTPLPEQVQPQGD